MRGRNARGGRVDETDKAMVEFARVTSGFGRARREIPNGGIRDDRDWGTKWMTGEGEGKVGGRKRLRITWVNSAGVEERNRQVGEDGGESGRVGSREGGGASLVMGRWSVR